MDETHPASIPDATVRIAMRAFMPEADRWTIKMVPHHVVRTTTDVGCDYCVYRYNDCTYKLMSRHRNREAAEKSFNFHCHQSAMRKALGAVAALA